MRDGDDGIGISAPHHRQRRPTFSNRAPVHPREGLLNAPVTIQVDDDDQTLVGGSGSSDSFDADGLLLDGPLSGDKPRKAPWHGDALASDWRAWWWPLPSWRQVQRSFRRRNGAYLPDGDEFRLTKGRRRSHGQAMRPVVRRPFLRSSRRIALVIGVAATIILYYLWSHFTLQVEIALISRPWIKQHTQLAPLGDCFNPARIARTAYNASLLTAPKHHQLTTGLPMHTGMECFDFAATIQQITDRPQQRLLYHTYWRGDLLPFEFRQAATIKSFLATQPLAASKLIIWSNAVSALESNPHVRHFLAIYGDNIELRQTDVRALAAGTYLDGSSAIGDGMYDQRGWVDGDAVRLLVLWAHGGVWLDMDHILTRDLHPLAEHEFVTQWDCYDKPYLSLNGAIMHFRQHSPYLCEAFHIMANSPPPTPNTLDWGSYLYQKLYHSLIAHHITPFTVLPWCFADPRNCRPNIRIPDPFKEDPKHWQGLPWAGGSGGSDNDRTGRTELEDRVGQIWSIHLHNQWGKAFPKDGWVARLLAGYDAQLEALELYGRMRHTV